jgi:hypothetical protein
VNKNISSPSIVRIYAIVVIGHCPPSDNSTELYGFGGAFSCYCPCNESSSFCSPFTVKSFAFMLQQVVCEQQTCVVKRWGVRMNLKSIWSISIYTKPHSSRAFSPDYLSFLRWRLLSHRPLVSYHAPTKLSAYQCCLLFALILPVHTSSLQLLFSVR